MKILAKIQVFPLVLISFALVFYLAILAHSSWLIYIPLSFLLIERVLLHIELAMNARAMSQFRKELVAEMAQVQQAGNSTGGIIGGKTQ